jgi:hypothetical protein
MAGQFWKVPEEGGYLYSDELSSKFRSALQPAMRFRMYCDADDGTEKGLNRGDAYHWDIVSDIATQGRELVEDERMPESGFSISQGTMTVKEFGNSVPFTGKLMALGKPVLTNIVERVLRNDAAKMFDIIAHAQFKATLLRVAPTGGTSVDSVTLTTNGATAITNNTPLQSGHLKAIGDLMRERNIPAYTPNGDYLAISHPTTFRPITNELELLHQYTASGVELSYAGEKGRYEGFRFCEQTQIPKGGANDSTSWDAYTKTADPWDNGQSSWAFFCGADTVTEGIVIPEEIRAKLPEDYGRSRGIGYYYLGNFKLVHYSDAVQGRVLMWDSAA